jgi:MFS family permease
MTDAASGEPARQSAWAPFRSRTFAEMWSAQFVSNVGGWMQTVGAQQLMLSLTTSPTPVALIQTAASLPMVLLAVPAGAAGDLVDRRRLLIGAQSLMLVAATALGLLAITGLVTPLIVLALIFVVGAGQALTAPIWQTLQPEFVAPEARTQAITLGAVNMNLGRAVGPAVGGALYAATGAGTLFLVNAASFVPVIGTVARWAGDPPRSSAAPEHAREAMRAGARYVAASPALRIVLLRAAGFMFFANGIWALLPLTAHQDLHLGSGGYGLLLGCVGLGAVSGAIVLPRLRTRLTPSALVTAGSVAIAGLAIVLAFVHLVGPAAFALVAGGLAWILVLSTLNSVYQSTLPPWIKARGMAYYLIVFQGAAALGAAALGLAARGAGLSTAMVSIAAGLAITAVIGLRLHFIAIAPQELLPAGDWPQPHLAVEDHPRGQMMVTIEYRPVRGREDEVLAALYAARFSRRRTGATSWRVWRDAADPERIVEQFVVDSWEEHVRQHERVSRRDQHRLDRIWAMTDPDRPPTVTHWLAPRLPPERPAKAPPARGAPD